MTEAANQRLRAGSFLWWRALGRVMWHAFKDFFHDNGLQWAGAIAYYSLLSVFPLLLAAVSIASTMIDPKWAIRQATEYLSSFIPEGSSAVQDVVNDAVSSGRATSAVSVLVLLWTGSYVFASLTKALNIAYDVDETYGVLRLLWIELLMLLTVGVVFVLALTSPLAIAWLRQTFQSWPEGRETVLGWLIAAVPGVLLVTAFFLMYRFVPRRRIDWKPALFGSMISALLFLGARPLFVYYVRRFAHYNLIYGSMAIVITLMFWAWIAAVILLYGGEVASHAHEILVERRSEKEVEERHLERSPDKKTRTKGRAVGSASARAWEGG